MDQGAGTVPCRQRMRKSQKVKRLKVIKPKILVSAKTMGLDDLIDLATFVCRWIRWQRLEDCLLDDERRAHFVARHVTEEGIASGLLEGKSQLGYAVTGNDHFPETLFAEFRRAVSFDA